MSKQLVLEGQIETFPREEVLRFIPRLYDTTVGGLIGITGCTKKKELAFLVIKKVITDSTIVSPSQENFFIGYEGVRDLDYPVAKEAVRVLRSITNKLNSLADQHGEPKSFGEVAKRFAIAINAKYFVFDSTLRPNLFSMDEAVEKIDWIIESAAQKMACSFAIPKSKIKIHTSAAV